MTWHPDGALNDFKAIAKLAGVDLSVDDVRIELLPAPHQAPTRLPSGMMAVYVFSRGNEVLKVGKVGLPAPLGYREARRQRQRWG